jgi:hypothetical protein
MRMTCYCGVCVLIVLSSVFCYVCIGGGGGMVMLVQGVKDWVECIKCVFHLIRCILVILKYVIFL